MGTFKQDTAKAKPAAEEVKTDADGGVDASKASASTTAGEQPTPEEVKADEDAKVNQAEAEGGETAAAQADELIASRELPVGELTDEDTQADTAPAEDAKELIVPGAAEGPDVAGVVRNHDGGVAYAPAGSLNAAMNGVQEDAAGHVDSLGTDNSSKSGTRI